MILVAGGTGRLGSQVVRLLANAGIPVRLMARGRSAPFPAGVDGVGVDDGVKRVRGDLTSRPDCEGAVAGCAAVVFTASGFGLRRAGNPRSVDRDGAIWLMEAAARAGVGHFVLLSMHGAAADAPLVFLRMKHAAEEALMSSGMEWTVIRIGPLLEQFAEVVGEPLAATGKARVFGSGQAPITFTGTSDAAALVVESLTNPALRNRTVEWGSVSATLDHLAQALIHLHGSGTIQHIPTVGLHLMAVAAAPLSPFMSRMARAALWMENGAAAFDPAPARVEFPAIPVIGLAQILAAG
ncbi:hypothetical protein ART_0473 [Arthrobacter sp. PAMC 25486]|uniref:SDR family oxidoreductase n=1 Tax=Arthrobacter sp. PAMC 25486 TaxID=1494608 RepID=UPI0005362494|nr:SDR family oxidoreductase [Arthrobacter sp. PAMC 25486]AIY00072.1 hypothetical protein ART_0473 [Arthrobacter sp. PAMC 25486]